MKSWPVLLAMALLLAPPGPALAGGEAGARAGDLGVYHTFDEMVSELQNLAAANPDILQMASIGKTYEGRDLWAVKLSDNVSRDEPEPNITILGGIHAGELIGVEVALHILFSLVGNYTTNATIGWYVNETQIWFVPMMNPDGHVYVEQGNQWRKNRSPNPGGTFGTDLNRNFGHLWGLEASHNPPDDDYCGPYAFSENETRAVDRLVRDHPPKITLSYHAFGQYILYPWGNSINQEPVDRRLIDIAANMSLAMPEGRRYLPMYAREMYSATGDTDDYFYMNLSLLPFTIELSTSFRPPDTDVPLICDDNYGPALYVLNYTAGAPPPPPPPPPKRALSLTGPEAFGCVPRQELWFNFTLANTGDLAEEVTVALASSPADWTAQLAPGKVNLAAGNNTTIAILLIVPERLPAGEAVSFFLRASAASGANASARLNGTVGVGRALNLEIGSPVVLEPGQNASIPVSVKNDGNAYDNISVAATVDTGWPVSQIPSPFELAPWTAANTFVRLRVPEGLPPGITRLNLTFEYWNADGSVRLNHTFPLAVETLLRLAWSVAPSGVVLYEGARQEVSVRLTNNGNVREKGNLSLKGDARFASLDRTAVDLQPGESGDYVLSLKGKPGAWKVNISYSSEYGYPDRQVGVGFTIKARPESPRNTLQDAIIALDLVFVLILAVYIVYRVRRKRQKGRVPK